MTAFATSEADKRPGRALPDMTFRGLYAGFRLPLLGGGGGGDGGGDGSGVCAVVLR